MASIPAEIALYVGLVLISLWIAYRLYLSTHMQSEGFTTNVNSDYSFVMYYADWCGHCQRAKPEFKRLGSTKTIGGKTVSIVAVNADENKALCTKKNVQGFPTIHLYDPSGTLVQEYSGERKLDSFEQLLSQYVK